MCLFWPLERKVWVAERENMVWGWQKGEGPSDGPWDSPREYSASLKGGKGPPSMVKLAKMTNIFFGATKHLFRRVRPSIHPSVHLSVCPSVRWSVTPSLMEEFRSTLGRVSGLVYKSLNSCSQSNVWAKRPHWIPKGGARPEVPWGRL